METGGGKARGRETEGGKARGRETGKDVMNVDEALRKIWIWGRLY